MRATTPLTTLIIGLSLGLFVESCGKSAASVCNRACSKAAECGFESETCEDDCRKLADFYDNVGSCGDNFLDYFDCISDSACGGSADPMCESESGFTFGADEGVPPCVLDDTPSACEKSCEKSLSCTPEFYDSVDDCIYSCVFARAGFATEIGDDCVDAYDAYTICASEGDCDVGAAQCVAEASELQAKCPYDDYTTY